MILLVLAVAALVLVAPLAWGIMLLIDPATQGAVTFSYGQSLAIAALLFLTAVPFTLKDES